jgi:hypothetical protein
VEKSNVFVIQKFEMWETIIASEIFEQGQQSFLENLELYGNIISNTSRSTFGKLLESHIGVELVNTYFQHLKKKLHFISKASKWNSTCSKTQVTFFLMWNILCMF